MFIFINKMSLPPRNSQSLEFLYLFLSKKEINFYQNGTFYINILSGLSFILTGEKYKRFYLQDTFYGLQFVFSPNPHFSYFSLFLNLHCFSWVNISKILIASYRSVLNKDPNIPEAISSLTFSKKRFFNFF